MGLSDLGGPNLNSNGSQGHNEEPDKPLNQNLQGDSEKISYISSNGPLGNCYKISNEHLIWHVLGEQNGGSTESSSKKSFE